MVPAPVSSAILPSVGRLGSEKQAQPAGLGVASLSDDCRLKMKFDRPRPAFLCARSAVVPIARKVVKSQPDIARNRHVLRYRYAIMNNYQVNVVIAAKNRAVLLFDCFRGLADRVLEAMLYAGR